MAGVFIKYFGALLLVVGVVCINGDGTEISETDLEMLDSHNQLLKSIYNEAVKLSIYVLRRSGELCKKMDNEEILLYKKIASEKSKKSVESVTHETILRNCINRIEDRFDPTASRDNVYGPDEPLLLKYGLEDIQKVVEQKYETFFEEILQQIKEYLKGLTPEQQRNTTARNLKGWSSKIKAASTLARKAMTFRSFMRYYFLQESV
ncbi:uncharacterized protein LOC120771493 [Bactrocera tryoni]|uniref:uncharacterized protein LOC120771493 n=1 Tax=Bactrocera tryoni TaxID=59916 RepID=UPI001A97031D|nr:uncharacterized protein LOC120771493 [Bactrocera tryoni]XP_039955475.1 uncharacterized protein LOC120771493 [Bactrocera tryoni]